MPDWFYRTVSRPVLNALPHDFSRGAVYRMMAGLSAVPGGTGLIDFLGHMAPSHRLQTELLGKPLLGPLGSSCWFDGAGVATAAWARFGFGFVELGPCWGSAPIVDSRFRVDLSQKSPAMESSVSLLPVSMMQARLRQCPSNIACLVRLMPGQAMAPTAAASELVELAHSLVDRVLGFSVDLRLASVGWGRADWDVFWRCLTTERDPIEGKACLSAENMVLVLGTSFSLREVQTACEWGIQHWMIETSRFEGGKLVLAHENTMELPGRIESLVSILKSPASSVLVQGCFTEPEEVSAAIDAGATGALIDLGLVVSGPGFAKRANDWLVSQKVSLESVHDRSSESTPVFRTS